MLTALSSNDAGKIQGELVSPRARIVQGLKDDPALYTLSLDGFGIINDMLKARVRLKLDNTTTREAAATAERQADIFRTRLDNANRTGAAEELVTNFETSLIMATADKAMSYEDARKEYETRKTARKIP